MCDSLHLPSSHKPVLVVPSKGCANCVKAALKATFQNGAENLPVTLVISGIDEDFYFLLADRFAIDSFNTSIDKKGRFIQSGLVSSSPVLFRSDSTGMVASELDMHHAETILTHIKP